MGGFHGEEWWNCVMTDMVEIPLERAQQFGVLLTVARTWRESVVPKTSTSTAPSFYDLLQAIAMFDEPDQKCKHPRGWRVFYTGYEICGYCGITTSQ
jgi:hypothetical protein